MDFHISGFRLATVLSVFAVVALFGPTAWMPDLAAEPESAEPAKQTDPAKPKIDLEAFRRELEELIKNDPNATQRAFILQLRAAVVVNISPTVVEFTLTNRDNKPAIVDRFPVGSNYVSITDPDGVQRKFRLDGSDADRHVINPGESKTWLHDAADFFKQKKRGAYTIVWVVGRSRSAPLYLSYQDDKPLTLRERKAYQVWLRRRVRERLAGEQQKDPNK